MTSNWGRRPARSRASEIPVSPCGQKMKNPRWTGEPRAGARPGPGAGSCWSTAPPGSLYLVIGFILVSVGVLLLNRQKMDQLQQMRPRSRRSVH